MGVELTENVADHAGALLVRASRADLLLVHREENPPMDRLEAVANIGDSSPDDDAHGVVEVAGPQLFLDADGDLLLNLRCFFHRVNASQHLRG